MTVRDLGRGRCEVAWSATFEADGIPASEAVEMLEGAFDLNSRALQHFPFILMLLLIEFLDEFVYGAREAAWPLIRDDLGLSYAQIGLLLGVPSVVGNLIEPFLAVLGDVWRRRAIVLGGGAAFAAALLLTALSHS